MARLKGDQIYLAASYHDNCHTDTLEKMIDNQEELERLNDHRKENRTMENFNEIIQEAIRMRKVWEHG